MNGLIHHLKEYKSFKIPKRLLNTIAINRVWEYSRGGVLIQASGLLSVDVGSIPLLNYCTDCKNGTYTFPACNSAIKIILMMKYGTKFTRSRLKKCNGTL